MQEGTATNSLRCLRFQHAPERIRTSDLRLRRPTLYPAELRAQTTVDGKRISRVLSPFAPRSGRRRTISLGRRSRAASCSLPGTPATWWSPRRGPRHCPCLALLRVGFTVPPPLPGSAVVSYTTVSPLPVPLRAIGGLFSVALSIALRRPGVTRHPALRSSDFPRPRSPLRVRTAAIRTRFPSCQTAYGDRLMRPGGVEPPTPGSEVRCSVQLSYGRAGSGPAAYRPEHKKLAAHLANVNPYIGGHLDDNRCGTTL
jgi:hypothetical protein